MKKIRVGIIGSAGYTGGELIRTLLQHLHTEIVFAHSKSNAGKYLYQVHRDLEGETELKFSDSLSDGVDVLFLCVGHTESKKFMDSYTVSEKIKIIDLSHDFRLVQTSIHGSRNFVYGLPEINREKIKTADNIANPGCFATAILLGLLPLVNGGFVNKVYTTGITGSTGAGQKLNETSHFSWRANNIQPYKTFTHQHLKEIGEVFKQLQPLSNVDINFVPWRGDFSRGIFVSSQLQCDKDLEELNKLYRGFYKDEPFITVTSEPLFLKQVINTNKAMIQLEKVENKLVVHSAIDNLLKGASGQAIQNMNLMFNMDETTGLKLKSNYF